MVPVILMYPFAFHIENTQSTGNKFFNIINYIDTSFIQATIGFLFVMLGMLLYKKNKSFPLYNFAKNSFLNFWENKFGVVLSFSILISITSLLIFKNIEFFKGREFAFQNPSIRPLVNLYLSLISIFGLNYFVVAFKNKSYFTYVLAIATVFMGLLIGTRSSSIGLIINYSIILLITFRYKNIIVLSCLFSAFILSALMIIGLRNNFPNIILGKNYYDIIFGNFFYGNNLSSLRDTAWVLSGFDNNFFWGKTYLAGFLSMIPSRLLDFRGTYSIGKITTVFSGLDSNTHPGLRLTLFGESYLNFGYLGIIVFGIIVGYYIRKLHVWVHQKDIKKTETMSRCFISLLLIEFMRNIIFTPGFFSVYVFIIIIFFGNHMSKLFNLRIK